MPLQLDWSWLGNALATCLETEIGQLDFVSTLLVETGFLYPLVLLLCSPFNLFLFTQ